MNNVRKALFKLLHIELIPSDFIDMPSYAPPDDIRRAQARLLELEPVRDSYCIFITNTKYGLFVSNIDGPLEAVIGRGVCVETDNASDISNAKALILILQALIYSGFNGKPAIEESDNKSLLVCQSYPPLIDLLQEVKVSDILQEISIVEGKSENCRRRIPAYLETINDIRRIAPVLLEPEGKPIFIEKSDDGVNIYGCPEDDTLTDVITRPIKVYGNSMSKERVVVLIIKKWSVDGASFDQPEPFRGGDNYYTRIVEELEKDIHRDAHQGLPSYQDLKTLGQYQRLSSAYSILSRYLHNQNHFRSFFDKIEDVQTFKVETPEGEPAEERVAFLDKALAHMNIDGTHYNEVIMLITTAPSMPLTDAYETLTSLYQKFIGHPCVIETHFLHGYRREGDPRAVLYVFTCTKISKSAE